MPRELKLPAYAKHVGGPVIEVDADKFYPAWLAELEVEEKDIDQYWLEVAYQCMKLEVQAAMAGTGAVPEGGALRILVQDNTKADNDGISKWALKRHPKGKGPEAATQGKEAREHYKRLRGGV